VTYPAEKERHRTLRNALAVRCEHLARRVEVSVCQACKLIYGVGHPARRAAAAEHVLVHNAVPRGDVRGNHHACLGRVERERAEECCDALRDAQVRCRMAERVRVVRVHRRVVRVRFRERRRICGRRALACVQPKHREQ
jgi:hypothetical protein